MKIIPSFWGFFLIGVFIYSCSIKNPKNDISLNKEQVKMLQESLNFIDSSTTFKDLKRVLKIENDCYLICPQFNKFSFSVLSSINLDSLKVMYENHLLSFEEREDRVNRKFELKYCSELLSFSPCNKSRMILKFSGFEKNILIGRLTIDPKDIKLNDIKNGCNKTSIGRQEFLYFFIFNSDGKLIKVYEDGVFY